jgi:hypothetical protein
MVISVILGHPEMGSFNHAIALGNSRSEDLADRFGHRRQISRRGLELRGRPNRSTDGTGSAERGDGSVDTGRRPLRPNSLTVGPPLVRGCLAPFEAVVGGSGEFYVPGCP